MRCQARLEGEQSTDLQDLWIRGAGMTHLRKLTWGLESPPHRPGVQL